MFIAVSCYCSLACLHLPPLIHPERLWLLWLLLSLTCWDLLRLDRLLASWYAARERGAIASWIRHVQTGASFPAAKRPSEAMRSLEAVCCLGFCLASFVVAPSLPVTVLYSLQFTNDYTWLPSMIQYMNELKGNRCRGITETGCKHSLTFSLQLWGRLNLLPWPVIFPEQSVAGWLWDVKHCPTITWHQNTGLFFFHWHELAQCGNRGLALGAMAPRSGAAEPAGWAEKSNFAAHRDLLCFINVHELY